MKSNKKPAKQYSFSDLPEEELSWEEIETAATAEIDAAIKFQKEVIVPQRTTNWDRYYGRPLGNEVPGKSQYMSRDLLETIEWILPNLIKLFASADHKIILKVYTQYDFGFEVTPEQLGRALMDQIYKDLYTDEAFGLFNVFYTWFKDALVSGSAYTKLFWEVDTTLADMSEVLDSAEELQELQALPDVSISSVKLAPTGQVEVEGQIERISKDQLVCDNIPHWEFVFEEHTRSMNDDTGKGFSTVVTLDYLRRVNQTYSTEEDSFFENLELIDALAPNSARYNDLDDGERKRYLGYEVLNDYVGADAKGADAKGPKRRVQLTEWFTRIDVNGDGFLEDVKVYVANGVMVRWELNEANFVPCAKISPILDCYKFQGIAYADLLVELQDLKTSLMRKMLDNYDLQNSGRWFVKPNTAIDIKRFLDNVPGDVHYIDPNKIKNEAPRGFDTSTLALLEYVEGTKENRTGSTRYNQGTDSSSLNQTAHGIQTIMSASMKRIEMIGTLFAEGGIKDFFKKAALITQQSLTDGFIAKINGEDIVIPPEAIQGEIVALTDMGQEDQAGQIESQKLLQMSAVLFDLNSKFPGLITPEKARNLAAKYVAILGYNSDTYLSSVADFTASTEQASQIQSAMQDLQVMIQKMEMQFKQEEINIDKITAVGEIVGLQAELETRLQIEKAKLAEKRGESLRTGQTDLFKTIYSQMNAPSPKQLS